jgi:hypothetical protein
LQNHLDPVIKRIERFAYRHGKEVLQWAGEPDPLGEMLRFRQGVMDPEDVVEQDDDSDTQSLISVSLQELYWNSTNASQTAEDVKVLISEDEKKESDEENWLEED